MVFLAWASLSDGKQVDFVGIWIAATRSLDFHSLQMTRYVWVQVSWWHRIVEVSRGVEWLTCLFSLKCYTCRLQIERCGSSHLCFVICEWSLSVMSGFVWFCLESLHFTVEALSLTAMLLGM